MRLISLLFFLIIATSSFADCFYSYEEKTFLKEKEFHQLVNPDAFVIMGEYHNSEKIQKAQAKIMSSLVEFHGQRDLFSFSWEFLDYPDQENIARSFENFEQDRISGNELLALLNNSRNKTYLHLLNVVKEKGGSLWGTNLPRPLKRKVVQGGIGAIDPKWIPNNFQLGGENYFERFKEAMGGHVGEDQLKSYFLAQSLTDAVIAQQLNKRDASHLKFLAVGSFHSDYFDGLIPLLEFSPVMALKVVENSEGWRDYLRPHPKYGNQADVLVVAGVDQSSCYADY